MTSTNQQFIGLAARRNAKLAAMPRRLPSALTQSLLAVLGLNACATPPPVAESQPRPSLEATAAAEEATRAGPWAYPSDAWASTDRASLAAWVAEAESILRDQEFRNTMRSLASPIADAYLNDERNSVSLAQLAETFELRAGAAVQVFSGPILRQSSGTPSAGADSASPTGTSIRMTSELLAFYTSGDVVKKSCAINSMAHEMSHLIGRRGASGFETVFHDSAAGAQCKKPSNADAMSVASYLVGSVAQCIWLQRQGRLAKDDSKGRGSTASMEDCVRVFGVIAFNRARCWSFADSDVIRERANIPCPACAPWSCATVPSGARLSPPHQPPCEAGTTTPTSQFRFDGPSGSCWLK